MSLKIGEEIKASTSTVSSTGVYQSTGTTNTDWVVLSKSDFDIQGTQDFGDNFITVNFANTGEGSAFIYLGDASSSNPTGIEVQPSQGVMISPPTNIGSKFSFKKGDASDKVTITADFGES